MHPPMVIYKWQLQCC